MCYSQAATNNCQINSAWSLDFAVSAHSLGAGVAWWSTPIMFMLFENKGDFLNQSPFRIR